MRPTILFIYCLYEDGTPWEVRYVGMSCNPNERLKQHLGENSSTAKGRWIRQVLGSGGDIGMRILEVVHSGEPLAGIRESYWINHFIRKNHPITNEVLRCSTGFLPRKCDPPPSKYKDSSVPDQGWEPVENQAPRIPSKPPTLRIEHMKNVFMCCWCNKHDSNVSVHIIPGKNGYERIVCQQCYDNPHKVVSST